MNNVLANTGWSREHMGSNDPFVSGQINLQSLEYMLLSAHGKGYTFYGTHDGERHIIKQIPLPAYGEYATMH